jgi:hypothetical protein
LVGHGEFLQQPAQPAATGIGGVKKLDVHEVSSLSGWHFVTCEMHAPKVWSQ